MPWRFLVGRGTGHAILHPLRGLEIAGNVRFVDERETAPDAWGRTDARDHT